jgi:hypothetical protein
VVDRFHQPLHCGGLEDKINIFLSGPDHPPELYFFDELIVDPNEVTDSLVRELLTCVRPTAGQPDNSHRGACELSVAAATDRSGLTIETPTSSCEALGLWSPLAQGRPDNVKRVQGRDDDAFSPEDS